MAKLSFLTSRILISSTNDGCTMLRLDLPSIKTATSWLTQYSHRIFLLLILALPMIGGGCSSFGGRKLIDRKLPTNDRNWTPEQRVLPYAEVQGTRYQIHNIRNNEYLSQDDFVVNHYQRQIDLSQVQTVDFIVVPFSLRGALAHTMISFGLDDGSYICLSVEVRREVGEKYQALAGLTRGYDLIYVLGDERDLIGVRAVHFETDVYLYPGNATPQQAQALFVDVMHRINQLKERPEFYHLITNNCTTNLKDHVNRISPNRIRDQALGVLLPGFSGRQAHQIGLIENRIPYDDLKQIAYINPLVTQHLDEPDFSQAIRSRRYRIDRQIARQENRQTTIAGRGREVINQAPSGRLFR